MAGLQKETSRYHQVFSSTAVPVRAAKNDLVAFAFSRAEVKLVPRPNLFDTESWTPGRDCLRPNCPFFQGGHLGLGPIATALSTKFSANIDTQGKFQSGYLDVLLESYSTLHMCVVIVLSL